jgi:hypothetical protein
MAAVGELVDRLAKPSGEPHPRPAPAAITIYSSEAPKRAPRATG